MTCRYLTSVFMNRSRADDILVAFKEGIEKLDPSRIIQVSMDGPNVNLKFLRLLNAERENKYPHLLDCGTCSLLVVNGSLKSADEKCDQWKIGKFLTAIYYVFRDTPMRRALLLHLNRLETCSFPMKFCAARWVENSKVTERAIDFLPKLDKFVEGVKGTRDEPTSASYLTTKEYLNDKLLPAKLAFFSKISSELEAFLVSYQSDDPMMPFMYEDLGLLVSTLLGRVVKKEVLEGKSMKQLCSIDLKDPAVKLNPEKVDLGFAVKDQIRKVRDELKKGDILQFRKEAVRFVTFVVQKINEKVFLSMP